MNSRALVKNSSELELLTGKKHVSFSEIKDWIECSYRHKLIHIDKLSKFDGSVYTAFGTAVHASCEEYIKTGIMKYELAIAEISREWDRLGFESKSLWLQKAIDVLQKVPGWLDNVFPGWEAVDAEELLYDPIPGSAHQNVSFKGYIDAIIKYKGKYLLLDWKTTGIKGWSKQKKDEFKTQMQLVCYDLIWSQKHKVPNSQIECAFVLLNRDIANGAKNALDLVTLEIDDDKRKKSLKVINTMISSVKRGVYFKAYKKLEYYNSPCKFCEFNGTEHCR